MSGMRLTRFTARLLAAAGQSARIGTTRMNSAHRMFHALRTTHSELYRGRYAVSGLNNFLLYLMNSEMIMMLG